MSEQHTHNKPGLLDRLDVSAIGFAVGIVVPLITFVVLYFLLYDYIPFTQYLTLSMGSETIQIILRAMVVANLPVFLLFNILKRFLFCRGIFYASMIYVMILFYLKFLA
jgi:hypothetical protein